ncbi:MAG TPA: exopolysaccharide biosynthesis polyprenyl glycosylphosphotransferase [Candidatus Paceibacterota bacterium]
MLNSNKKEPFILFVGDVCIFLVALWLMLFFRYGDLPSATIFIEHLVPFTMLFFVWVVVFFIGGLYEKHTVLFKSRLPSVLLNVVIINSVIAVLFFYFIPVFGITPKTNLFIYLIISFLLLLVWRMQSDVVLGTRRKEKAMIIGVGEEMKELREEVNNNTRYGLEFVTSIDLNDLESIDFKEEVLNRIYSEGVEAVAVDLRNEKIEPFLPSLYNLIFSKVRFFDMHKIYEDIFDRVPLSLLKYNWFLENISVSPKITYDALKRVMDIALSFVLGILSLLAYPFVFLAIKLEDGGQLFITQERTGKNNQLVKIVKFRSMSGDDSGNYGQGGTSKLRVTRVGKFLRKSRIDELPQLWNVFKGDISLIGPRPELPALVRLYEKEIPYYNIRHLIKPGLSGWAQIYHENHPHHGEAVVATKEKLSYDLYYIKNRSFILDLKIALKTLRDLVSRRGR